MKIRGRAKVQVRGPIKTRSGEFDDGRKWSVREVEVIDEDQNKTMIRVDEAMAIESGVYDIEFDASTKGTARVDLIRFTPVKG